MKTRILMSLLLVLFCIPTLRGDDAGDAAIPPVLKAAEESFKEAREKAQADFDTRRKPLEAEREAKVAAAKKIYLQSIETAAKEAMRTGDLTRANQLAELKQTLSDAPEATTGGVVAEEVPSRAYVCTLEHFELVVHDGWFGKAGVCRIPDLKITVDGKYSPNGICMHPPPRGYAKVQFHLDGKYSKFVSGTALNDSCLGNDKAHITFEVLGDGKTLWKGAPLDKWKTIYNCSVNVKGVQVIELRVNCPGESNYQHAVWIEPQVLR